MVTQPSPKAQAWIRGWDAFTLGKERFAGDGDPFPEEWRKGWDANREQRFVGDPDEFETPQDLEPDAHLYHEDSDGRILENPQS